MCCAGCQIYGLWNSESCSSRTPHEPPEVVVPAQVRDLPHEVVPVARIRADDDVPIVQHAIAARSYRVGAGGLVRCVTVVGATESAETNNVFIILLRKIMFCK